MGFLTESLREETILLPAPGEREGVSYCFGIMGSRRYKGAEDKEWARASRPCV